MDYTLEKELNPECLRVNDGKERLILDKMTFGVPPRETIRLEMQRDIKEIIRKEDAVTAENLIKYQVLDKFQNEIFLARRETYGEIKGLDSLPLEEAIPALCSLLGIIKNYHEAGLVVGGLSPGQLKKNTQGKVLLQDPPVMNYLSKSLGTDYRIDSPAEVIRGGVWSEKSDVFSWGVLAYRLLTGEDPYAAKTPEERLEKIMRIGAAPPRNFQPRLSEGLSRFIMSCLEPFPEKRPTVDSLTAKLQDMEASGELFLSETQAAEFAEKAKANLQKQQVKEGVWFWFRKYGLAVGIGLGVVAFFTLMTVFSGAKKTITQKTTPEQVVGYYFQAIRKLDTTLLDEAIHKADHSFEGMVTNLYVINRTQQGMTQNLKDYIKVTVTGPEQRILSKRSNSVEYDLNYQIEVDLAQRKEFFKRHDVFRVEPVNRIWRITDIKVVNEKHWSEKINPPASPPASPAGTSGK